MFYYQFGYFCSDHELPSIETKLVTQMKEAETNALNCQTKVNDLSYQINELERNLTVKTWNIERKYTRMMIISTSATIHCAAEMFVVLRSFAPCCMHVHVILTFVSTTIVRLARHVLATTGKGSKSMCDT